MPIEEEAVQRFTAMQSLNRWESQFLQAFTEQILPVADTRE